MVRTVLLLVFMLALAACTGDASQPNDPPVTEALSTTSLSVGAGGLSAERPDGPAIDSRGSELPPAPDHPDGPLDPDAVDNLEQIYETLQTGVDTDAIEALAASDDPRLGWVLADLLRFFPRGQVTDSVVNTFGNLMGTSLTSSPSRVPWTEVSNLMIAWDLPAPPDYTDYKARLFTLVEPGWAPFFEDAGADIDWRWVSWGGVLMDQRVLGDQSPCPRGCIPALDDPSVTDAEGGSWYPDDSIVFAVTVNGESRAYPKNIMEVHEMVNDTLGGRRLGMPYCTLCGSAQAYLTDSVPPGIETPVLRTSGLLSRSNKVMYDLISKSVFDTFLGTAVSGPLREAGVTLEQVSMIATTWGEWKAAHPDTTIVAEDGGIGRSYPADPLRGRDDDGPIFPVGDVDPRLAVQEPVIGVETPDGTAIAFPTGQVREVLGGGGDIRVAGVELEIDGGGVRAYLDDGTELATHQAFWFAWSQFRPDTLLWEA